MKTFEEWFEESGQKYNCKAGEPPPMEEVYDMGAFYKEEEMLRFAEWVANHSNNKWVELEDGHEVKSIDKAYAYWQTNIDGKEKP